MHRHIFAGNKAIPKHIPSLVRLLLAPLALLVIVVSLGANAAIDEAQLEVLDQRFQKISSAFYQDYLRSKQGRLQKIGNIKKLARHAKILEQRGDHVAAIAHIIANLTTVKKDIEHEATFDLVALLLKYNEWYGAGEILVHAKSEADDYTVSSLNFLFAEHYFKRKQWQQSVSLLKTATVYDALSERDNHYALIMQGVALQHFKKHREAIKYYERVPKGSIYYNHAQLNSAIVNIRQGWWTDAHIIINALLKEGNAFQSDAMTDRLYTVLAYSMLMHEFYRDSRETFRNVSLNGPYANRALLGLGLSAANQGDYVGALNALTILKEKESLDLYTEETYLLLPYIYEKLRQGMTASAGYSEAITYYQQRIAKLEEIKSSDASVIAAYFTGSREQVQTVAGQPLNFSDRYSPFFLENFAELYKFKKNTTNTKLGQEIDALYRNYVNAFAAMTKALIDERIGYLNSYLSQCRYGLAKLYDKK